jgi:hypothetical protein
VSLPVVVSVPAAGDTHRWFVASSRRPGTYYLVELAGDQADRRLTCSCPFGAKGEARPCRHLRSVNDLVAAMAGAS